MRLFFLAPVARPLTLSTTLASHSTGRASGLSGATPPALGGDLLPGVEAMSAVVVAVLEVLGDELQAVGAPMHLLRVVRVDRGHAVVAAQRVVH